jgi:hypothetical protein
LRLFGAWAGIVKLTGIMESHIYTRFIAFCADNNLSAGLTFGLQVCCCTSRHCRWWDA